MQHTSSITSTKACTSSSGRQQIASSRSLHTRSSESSIREGISRSRNLRPIKRLRSQRWVVGVRKQDEMVISTLYNQRDQFPPLSGSEIVGGSVESTSIGSSMPKFPGANELGVLRALSICWTASLYDSTLPSSYSVHGMLALVLSACSISRIILESQFKRGRELGQGRVENHGTLQDPQVPTAPIR